MRQPFDSAEAGRPALRRALDHLPTHEPDAALWPCIAGQLRAEAAVSRAVPELPAHEPGAELWDRIVARLDQPATVMPAALPAKAPVRRLQPAYRLAPRYRVAVGMAATVLLALAIWQLRPAFPAATSRHDTLAYGQETVAGPAVAWAGPNVTDPLDQRGLAFIDARCSALPTVCQSANFQQLRAQLAELEATEQRLRQAERRLGATPEVVRGQVQVTTLKATVTRELIHLLIS